ncbi:MAG: leucyl aminopeptidase [Cyanobacteriota bacterium]
MQINVIQGSLPEIECDALIVNLFEGVTDPGGGTGAVNKALEGLLKIELIDKDEFKAKLGSISILPTYGKIPARKVVLVGLGKKEDFDLNSIRKVSAEAIKACKKLKALKVCSILHGASIDTLSASECAQALAEGAILAAYKFDKYKSKKSDTDDDEPKVDINELNIVEFDHNKISDIQTGINKGTIIAQATNLARDLANEPASYLTPTKLSEVAESIGLECKVFDKDEIEKMGMNSYLGVSQGSVQPPKFIHLIYRPDGTPKKKIALVGKGITFDSGGLCLKPATGMLDMKKDMSGAAATLGVLKAIKDLKPDLEIHGIIPACENMPDGNSYKPGDILKAKNGKTIEIINTDAEGRLILADALCYAVEQGVDEIIDIATLTGAVVVALGNACAGIMTNKQELVDSFVEKIKYSGEKVWQLPIMTEYEEQLKSDIADIKNLGNREAGSSVGGMLLKEFVGDTPWLHIDIAGVAWKSADKYENPKGCSGFGVRSIVYYLLNH